MEIAMENAQEVNDNEIKNLIYNLHENIAVKPNQKWAIVSGCYAYYHYGQHGLDDSGLFIQLNKLIAIILISGWGCAYRSFQTICSWLKQQGHVSQPVPTHQEIQQCLVTIGDKPSNFVGSRKWIGSLELSYCLETMFGITSKILTSKSGADLSEHARVLIYHFENGGAPVMIGGGQLAHTILGIDYNPRLGTAQYLVLDPHYNGDDNPNEVLAGGWCGWKPASFWNKKDFYNLLLIITPEAKDEPSKA